LKTDKSKKILQTLPPAINSCIYHNNINAMIIYKGNDQKKRKEKREKRKKQN